MSVPPKVVALVPARSGSKSIEDKNLSLITGMTLLERAILFGQASPGIDEVFVSTDSQLYGSCAEACGGKVPFMRPAEISSDAATDYDVFVHFLQWFRDFYDGLPDYIIHLRPTTPFRTVGWVESALEKFQSLQGEGFQSMRSMHKMEETAFKCMVSGKNNDAIYLNSLIEDFQNLDANGPRQVFPDTYSPNGAVDIIVPETLGSTGTLHGTLIAPFYTPPIREVDGPDDLEILRALAKGGYFEELEVI